MPELPTVRPRTLLRSTALAAALAGPLGAWAASEAAAPDLTTLPLEALLNMEVFSASRFAQKTSEAPSSVTVITAEEMRSYGWRTLADVARSVRGLYVSYDRNYSYLGARGFQRPGDYNTRFLLLVDGYKINDAVYDQAPVGGEFPLDLDLIERIEFVPGPGSSVYGSNALFGVINVITRSGRAVPDSRVAIEVGQHGLRRASVTHAWRNEAGLGVLVGASRSISAGQDLYYAQFDTPAQNHGVAQGLDYERANRAYARASYGPLSLSLVMAERLKGIPTAAFAQAFNDPRSRTNDRQAYLGLGYRDFLGPLEELHLRLTAGRYDSIGDYVAGDGSGTVQRDGSQARWWNGDVRLLSTRWEGHKIVAGVDFERDTSLRQFAYDLAPYALFLDDERRASRSGAYLQDEMAIGPDLLLNLGLRRDSISGLAHVTSPRVALIWQAGRQTTLKAIHGTAFRAPNSYEKYYAFPGPGGQLANPQLGKEHIASSELIWIEQIGEQARLTATAFRNVVTGMVTLEENPVTQMTRFDNAGRVRSHGLELEYERRWRSGAMLRTSYSYARLAEQVMGQQQASLPNAPAHLAKVNLALPVGSAWRAGLEAQFVGKRHNWAGATDSFWLANLHLASARLAGGAEVSLTVTNLFDQAYADPGAPEHRQASIAQDGRILRVGLAYAF